jgi:hypothetical protein
MLAMATFVRDGDGVPEGVTCSCWPVPDIRSRIRVAAVGAAQQISTLILLRS